jgi:hypothetical protein
LFATVIFAGIVVCVSAFALVVGSLWQNAAANGATATPTRQGTGLGIIETKREERDTCLIKAVDADTRTFTLYGIKSGRTYFATAANSTDMKDRFGNNLVFAEYRPGDVVDVTYFENDPILLSIRHSAQAQTFFNQEGVIVTNDRITLGNTTYIYGQELVSLYKGEPYAPTAITTSDRVTMRVFENVCVYIEITTGNGVIDVLFNEHIRGGNIAIGNNIYSRLDESRQFTVPEGNHQVIIKGDNIEDFVRTLPVRNGESTTIDLSDAQFKRGFIYFQSNVEEIYMTIQGTEWDFKTPVELEYGTYAIRATAFGYQTFERTIELRDPMLNFPINMVPLPTPTPMPERQDTTRVTIVTSNVGGVEIFIDGEYVGRTAEGFNVTTHSLTFDALVGSRDIRLTRPGYRTTDHTLLILSTNIGQEYSFFMHPEDISVPVLP